MKNVMKISAALCVAALAFSCQKASEVSTPDKNQVTITCEFPSMVAENGTKVSLSNTGTTQWQAGDKIIIFGKTATEAVIHEIAAGEITDPKKAIFNVTLPATVSKYGAHPYNIAYPYDPENTPFTSSTSDDSGRARFHNTNQLLMAGYVDGGKAVLYNLNAAILFKVSGDFDKYNFMGADGSEIVGYSDYLCQMNDDDPVYRKKYLKDNGTAGPLTKISGTVKGDGSTYNYIYLPVNNSTEEGDDADAISLPNGFTIQFLKEGKIIKTITSTAGLTTLPGYYIDLGLLDNTKMKDYEAIPSSEKQNATELSASESANCYVVNGGDSSNKDKVFKFRAVKGNTYVKDSSEGTSVGTVASADILWETWNDNVKNTITSNSVIKAVDVKDGFVYFKMPSTLHTGNALIAAKDASGNVLWSWHIWVPETMFTAGNLGGLSSQDMMSRNLGALIDAPDNNTDSRSAGLYYQWGRKDPFVGYKWGSTSYDIGVSGESGRNMKKSTTAFTIEQSIANPTTMVTIKGDWLAEHNNDLWGVGAQKTIYDPCPAGYRVPQVISDDDFWKGVAGLDSFSADGTIGYWKVGNAVFNMAGYYDYDGGMSHPFDRSAIWSNKLYETDAQDRGTCQYAYYENEAWHGSASEKRKACALSVRCVKEATE